MQTNSTRIGCTDENVVKRRYKDIALLSTSYPNAKGCHDRQVTLLPYSCLQFYHLL